ncbi:FHIPEP family type III secretion protein [Arsenophonus endosymbiont of Aleurodicus floccissimus]|uniref:FHIPEP family type III secretion protein n=1 Tax=Arsenophonus endosymbiont of Aleurodicus floccissimus TaxID=2152761 RepID=UPI002101EAD6|nr:FHIPEP family type III secretion protein [Arsenophonus endosymbiont of Aleurodicus floccissimus]
MNGSVKELPKLTQDLMPDVINLTLFHKVLQNLLSEQAPIRDIRTIIETLAEHAAEQKEVMELTSLVRIALASAITQYWFGDKQEIQAIGLDVSLERVLIQALQSGGGLEPGQAGNIEQQAIEAINNQSLIGAP